MSGLVEKSDSDHNRIEPVGIEGKVIEGGICTGEEDKENSSFSFPGKVEMVEKKAKDELLQNLREESSAVDKMKDQVKEQMKTALNQLKSFQSRLESSASLSPIVDGESPLQDRIDELHDEIPQIDARIESVASASEIVLEESRKVFSKTMHDIQVVREKISTYIMRHKNFHSMPKWLYLISGGGLFAFLLQIWRTRRVPFRLLHSLRRTFAGILALFLFTSGVSSLYQLIVPPQIVFESVRDEESEEGSDD
jgi:hypothetical protein